MKTGYILGVSRGHNSGVCLLKDGQIVFSIEEERLSRHKYDGSPYAAIKKVLEYTDKVDYVVVVHTQSLKEQGSAAGRIEYTGDDTYTGLARKFGLIDRKVQNIYEHPQVIDMSLRHHAAHAALAFYNSGFEKAAAVVVDGAGSAFQDHFGNVLWEVESILDCSYDVGLVTKFKHIATRNPIPASVTYNMNGEFFGEPYNNTATVVISDKAGIVKSYEAVTQYCGFSAIEAGKTMGLFPYGKPNDKLPNLFTNGSIFGSVSRDVIVPTYPNAAVLNSEMYSELAGYTSPDEDVTLLQNRRDAAYWIQKSTQQAVLNYIIHASEITGHKQVVLSGGYGLNCVANYAYLDKLNELDIEFYVEPMSNDGGTAIGAALLFYYENIAQDKSVRPRQDTLYLGPEYKLTQKDFDNLDSRVVIQDNVTYSDIVNLLRQKNIVTIFQGRSENGPRALGNRSVLFDPTFKDGKDFVNTVKRREYFRPFAASVLEEKAPEWFNMKGMERSPHMMYAVDCNEGVADKVPSVIHEDGTCRIQTVSETDNLHYYNLIKEFEKVTGVPMLFNTSFNLGGEPLVETLDDAVWTLLQSDIEYCYLPEYSKLLIVKNEVKNE
jgi:carbamoyltransferase